MKFLIRHTSILSVLLCSNALCGQCLVNPYKPLQTPAEELGLLPDTPSYYIEENVFLHDSLIYNCTIETLHNYGDRRVAVYTDEFAHAYVQSVVSLKRMEDSMWVQSSEHYYASGLYADTLFVWLHDGIVHRAITTGELGKRTFYFTYNDRGQLIAKRTIDENSVVTECIYLYTADKLLTMHCISTNHDTMELSITYTDTLTTTFRKDARKNRKTYFSKHLNSLDTCGNILSTTWISRFEEEEESIPFGTTEFNYYRDGSYQAKYPSSAVGPANTVIYFPGKYYPETRSKEDMTNVERVRRTIWIN